MLYNHVDLRFQFDYQGDTLQNLHLLVCQTCYDKPNELNRPVILPPDPVPIRDARPEQYDVEVDGDFLTLFAEDGITILFAEDGVTELHREGYA